MYDKIHYKKKKKKNCSIQYASKFGKTSRGHRTGKGQFSSQSQRRAVPKNVKTTAQLHSFLMLVRLCSKILQARLQQYLNTKNFQVYKLDLKKAEEPYQTANWITDKAREFQKKTASASLTVGKPTKTNCGQFLEVGIPDQLTCLLRNLYAGQEATLRTLHGTTDGFNIEKGARQGCMSSPCLFNLSAEYIMRNAGLDELQAGIKTAGRNINNLRYADDTTLMAQSAEELNSLLMKVKEEREKDGLQLSTQKTNIMTFSPITSWQIDGEKVEAVTEFLVLCSKITVDSDYSYDIRSLLLGQ